MKANFLNSLISVLLMILIIAGILPCTAFAADDGSDNNNNSTVDSLPDLIIDTFKYPESSVTENHEQIQISVKNQGSTASEATKLNLYIGDTYVREWEVPRLSAGQSTDIQLETWIPSSGGQVNIKAMVDEDNLVKEINENNNQNISTISVIEKEDLEDQHPDLIIEDIVPETAQAVEGQMLNVTLKVKNQGMVPSGDALARYYINGVQGQSELQVPALLAGETANVIFSLIPEKEGEVEIKGFVDSGTSVYEGDVNESNNELTEIIIVKALLPDLTIESLSLTPETLEPDKNTTFTATIRNNGPGNSLSTELSYIITGTNDTASGKIPVPALTAGQTTTGTFSWTPKTEGKKEIKLGVDSGTLVTETDENNNGLTKTITVAKKIVPGQNEQNNSSTTGPDSGSNSGSGSKSSSKSNSKSKSSMGSGISQEPAKNIDVKELSTRYVISGYHMRYDFPENVTCITFVEYDAKRTFKKTTTTVEMLKDKSNLVKALPSGNVYKHVNIWVGEKGAGLPDALENGVVGFKVEKAWINKYNNNANKDSNNNENKNDKSSTKNNKDANEPEIILQWYDKEWKPLETEKTGEDKKYVYFEAKSPAYSSFAITDTQQSINKQENKTQGETGAHETLLNAEENNEKGTINGSAQKKDSGIKEPMGMAKILMAISLPAFLILVEYFILKKKI